MGKREVEWVDNLPRTKVKGTERDVLRVHAELSGKDGLVFASNQTIADRAGITRRHAINCKKSLLKKRLLVRAQVPRFKTETVWYFLPVGCTELKINPRVLRDKVSTSTSEKISPYIGLRVKRRHTSSSSSAETPIRMNERAGFFRKEESAANKQNNADQDQQLRSADSEEEKSPSPTPSRLRAEAIRKKWFEEEFWKAYPRRQHKKQAREVFMAFQPSRYLLDRILDGVAAYKRELAVLGREAHEVQLPERWLRGKRWEDDYAPIPKVRRLQL